MIADPDARERAASSLHDAARIVLRTTGAVGTPLEHPGAGKVRALLDGSPD